MMNPFRRASVRYGRAPEPETRPMAPFDDSARGLLVLSTRMTARIHAAGILKRRDASAMCSA